MLHVQLPRIAEKQHQIMKNIPGNSIRVGDYLMSLDENQSFVYSLVLKVVKYKDGEFELILLHDNAICPYGPFEYTKHKVFELFDAKNTQQYKDFKCYHNHGEILVLQP